MFKVIDGKKVKELSKINCYFSKWDSEGYNEEIGYTKTSKGFKTLYKYKTNVDFEFDCIKIGDIFYEGEDIEISFEGINCIIVINKKESECNNMEINKIIKREDSNQIVGCVINKERLMASTPNYLGKLLLEDLQTGEKGVGCVYPLYVGKYPICDINIDGTILCVSYKNGDVYKYKIYSK